MRTYLVPAGTAIVGVLTATPGVHLFERWLAPTSAILVSHALALALVGLATTQWRARRARVVDAVSRPD
jgi:glucose uptake protein GlcU